MVKDEEETRPSKPEEETGPDKITWSLIHGWALRYTKRLQLPALVSPPDLAAWCWDREVSLHKWPFSAPTQVEHQLRQSIQYLRELVELEATCRGSNNEQSPINTDDIQHAQNMWWSSYRACQCHRPTHWKWDHRRKEEKRWTIWLPNSSSMKKLYTPQYRTASHLQNDCPRTYNNSMEKLKTTNNLKKTTKSLRRKRPMPCQYRWEFLPLCSRCSPARERVHTTR